MWMHAHLHVPVRSQICNVFVDVHPKHPPNVYRANDLVPLQYHHHPCADLLTDLRVACRCIHFCCVHDLFPLCVDLLTDVRGVCEGIHLCSANELLPPLCADLLTDVRGVCACIHLCCANELLPLCADLLTDVRSVCGCFHLCCAHDCPAVPSGKPVGAGLAHSAFWAEHSFHLQASRPCLVYFQDWLSLSCLFPGKVLLVFLSISRKSCPCLFPGLLSLSCLFPG